MLEHPRALAGLSDAGAHVGTVCDASFTTFMLTHWVRDRADRPAAARAGDRDDDAAATRATSGSPIAARIAPGQRADLNVIDPQRAAACGAPRLVRDLPAGGKRFLQKADGYVGTWVDGRPVQRDGQVSGERPGRLVRLGSKRSASSRSG